MIVALAIEDELAHELVIPILGSLEAKSLSKIAIVRRFGTPTVTNWKKIRDLWMRDEDWSMSPIVVPLDETNQRRNKDKKLAVLPKIYALACTTCPGQVQ